MVAHPHELALPREVAARAAELESVRAISEEIEPVPVPDGAAPFSNVSAPAEVYELRLAGCSLGRLVHDVTRLRGLGGSSGCWVLAQKDADLVLTARAYDDALAQARHMLAVRLPDLPTRPGPRQERYGGTPRLAVAAAAAVALVVVGRVLARRRDRRHPSGAGLTWAPASRSRARRIRRRPCRRARRCGSPRARRGRLYAPRRDRGRARR